MHFVVALKTVVDAARRTVCQQRPKDVARVVVGCPAAAVVAQRSRGPELRELNREELGTHV